jgi:hypothetical protein
MTSNEFPYGTFSLAEMDAALERAHVERAKAMRAMLVALSAGVKRFVGSLHLQREHHLPHAKVSA